MDTRDYWVGEATGRIRRVEERVSPSERRRYRLLLLLRFSVRLLLIAAPVLLGIRLLMNWQPRRK